MLPEIPPLSLRRPRHTSFSKKDELFEAKTRLGSDPEVSGEDNGEEDGEYDEDENPYTDVLTFARRDTDVKVRD